VLATVKGVGHRYTAEEVLEAAVATALETGMTGLTFARVGEQLGASDRMVVYYFPTKTDLITAVAVQLGTELQTLLADAFGDRPREPRELLSVAWPVLATKRSDRIFGLFFEMIGLASAGHAPYTDLVGSVMNSWADWLAERVKGSRADIRRQRALAVMAQIDGLLMIRRTMGAAAANSAARDIL